MTLRIGLLSTARINANLAAGAQAARETRVVAIASRELARAQAQARDLGVERAHPSYEALLADDEVDVVYVSLPNEMHHEWSCARSPPASTCSARSRTRARPARCWRRLQLRRPPASCLRRR